jgi:hypothetical protein
MKTARCSLPLLAILFLSAPCALFACKGSEETSPSLDPGASAFASAMASAMAKATPSGDGLQADARDQFEKKFSCPTDRVTIKTRSGVDAVPPMRQKVAPAEVQNDPGRLEKWKSDQAKELEEHRAAASDHVVYEISGCDHHQLVNCRPRHAHGAVYPNSADCSEM